MSEMTYDDLEKKVLSSLEKTNFAQESKVDFEMPNVIPTKEILGLGIGAGLGGFISGAVVKYIPIDLTKFGIDGLPQILVGTAIKVLAKPKGMLKDATNGMLVSGIAIAIQGLTEGRLPDLSQERSISKSENTQIPNGVVF
jgi:hypothetical protein